MTRRTRVGRSGGFTLIELLVVIAIIAILVSILVPALFSARRAAGTAASLSNSRQLVTAWHLYCNDYTHFPFWLNEGYVDSNDPDLGTELQYPSFYAARYVWGGVNWYPDGDEEFDRGFRREDRVVNPYVSDTANLEARLDAFKSPNDDGLKRFGYDTQPGFGGEDPYVSFSGMSYGNRSGEAEAPGDATWYGLAGTSYQCNEFIWAKPGFCGDLVNDNDISAGLQTRNGMHSVSDPSQFVLLGSAGQMMIGRGWTNPDFNPTWAYTGFGYPGGWWYGERKANFAKADGSAGIFDCMNGPHTGSYSFYLDPSKYDVDYWIRVPGGRGCDGNLLSQ